MLSPEGALDGWFRPKHINQEIRELFGVDFEADGLEDELGDLDALRCFLMLVKKLRV